MEDGSYKGLTSQEAERRKEQGLVNITDHNIFKTKKQIIIAHTVTYFNFLNLFLGILVLISDSIRILPLWESLS